MAASSSNKDMRQFREKYRGKDGLKGLKAQLPQNLYKFSKENVANVANPSIPLKQKKNKMIQSSGHQVWKKVYIYHGSIVDDDLIENEVDAIVNPANECLWSHGSGVCAAIFRAAGYKELEQACNAITNKTDDNRIPTGQTVATKAFALRKLQYILHTIAPCEQNNEDLISCYISALELCVILGIRCVAFPCVGTGDGNFSKQAACSIALRSVKGWLCDAKAVKFKDFMRKATHKKWHHNIKDEMNIKDENKADDEDIYIDNDETVADRINCVIFCCFDEENWKLYKATVAKIYPSSDNKHSYSWIDKVRSEDVEILLHHIQSLEMEKQKLIQLKSADDESKENDDEQKMQTKNVTSNLEKIYQTLISVLAKFEEKYTENKIYESSPKDIIKIQQVVLNHMKWLKEIKVTIDSSLKTAEKVKSLVEKNSTPNKTKYKEWNIDEILMFIMSIENGKFVDHIDQLRQGFVASEIECGELLPDLTRSDLSVPPFNINSFIVKKELINHFQSLKKGGYNDDDDDDDDDDDNNNIEEGDDDNNDTLTH